MFRVRLTPFDAEETRQYIASRLVTAGTRSSLFTADASNAVHDFSSGIPRLINVICDNAMLAGYVADRPVIEKEFIEEVAADLKLVSAATARNYVLAVEKDTGRRSSMSRGQLVFTVAIACLVLVASLTVVAAMGG
jgi:general secretion pathway protein A